MMVKVILHLITVSMSEEASAIMTLSVILPSRRAANGQKYTRLLLMPKSNLKCVSRFCGGATVLHTHPVSNSAKIFYSTFISLMHSSLCASISLAFLHPSSFSVLHFFSLVSFLVSLKSSSTS